MRFLVCSGMYRARGALFSTKDTALTEKPLSRAISRMVTREPCRRSVNLKYLPVQRIYPSTVSTCGNSRKLKQETRPQPALGCPASSVHIVLNLYSYV